MPRLCILLLSLNSLRKLYPLFDGKIFEIFCILSYGNTHVFEMYRSRISIILYILELNTTICCIQTGYNYLLYTDIKIHSIISWSTCLSSRVISRKTLDWKGLLNLPAMLEDRRCQHLCFDILKEIWINTSSIILEVPTLTFPASCTVYLHTLGHVDQHFQHDAGSVNLEVSNIMQTKGHMDWHFQHDAPSVIIDFALRKVFQRLHFQHDA
jgi:hypothetical protein